VGKFHRSGSTLQELVLLPRLPLRFRLFQHVLVPRTVLHFLFVPDFLWLFPDAAIRVLIESINITPVTLVVGSFFIAPMMASCSVLNIDNCLLSFFVSIADRLRPRILLFLPSLTRRRWCRSLSVYWPSEYDFGSSRQIPSSSSF
jgi:hypothetical protein